MGKRLSPTLPRRGGFPTRAACLLLVVLSLAGCAAASGDNEADNKHGGFYGGVTGGAISP